MILKISTNKTRYDKGQIFPFLIAIIVVIIIIAMITVNLGQIGVFKTDVSNAADAAALAGASTLSGYLLGFGLASDMMCGKMIVVAAAIIIEAITFVGIPAAIATYIAFVVGMLVTYFQSLEDGKMAWSNAKKTALQYAFQNAGIDEPRPTFKQFLEGVYGISDPNSISAEMIADCNRIYSLGDNPDADTQTREKIRNFTQSGFSRFMEKNKYWDEGAWGKIEPGNISPAIITSGYGWSVDNQGMASNSYDNGSNYRNYDNYVEAQVTANVIYPLQFYNPISEVLDEIKDWIEENIVLPWWLQWFEGIVQWIISLVVGLLAVLFPGGLKMDPIEQNTDNNPITVTVRRFKKSTDLGLWRFRYGTVEAEASGRVYGEVDADGIKHDIKPLLWGNLWSLIQSVFGGGNWDWDWFDTKKHLFETELIHTR